MISFYHNNLFGVFMKYVVLPSYVWTYPDIHSYPEGKECADLISLRDGYATFQVHLYDIEA